MSDSIAELTTRIRDFAAARDWEQFHTPKNLAMALIVEAAELVEQFQWLTPGESATMVEGHEGRQAVTDEIADVAIYLMRLADVVGVDLGQAVEAKLATNDDRFPITAPGAGGEM
ncbi:MAG: nucleotide pyrophosphohydrolase [Phycisphaerales bacterium JB038]